MGIFDPTPEDSPTVARLKQQLAEEQARETAGPEPQAQGEPEQEAVPAVGEHYLPKDDAVAPEATSAEADLRAQLDAKQREIDDLTARTLAQKDPETADPSVDVRDLLHQLITAQGEQRNEMAQLRAEVAKARRQPIPTTTVAIPSAEELQAARQAEVDNAKFYCPGCGRLYGYQRECVGVAESPHPAIEVVPTDELKNPPDPSDKEAVAQFRNGHTQMAYSEPGTDERLSLVG